MRHQLQHLFLYWQVFALYRVVNQRHDIYGSAKRYAVMNGPAYFLGILQE